MRGAKYSRRNARRRLLDQEEERAGDSGFCREQLLALGAETTRAFLADGSQLPANKAGCSRSCVIASPAKALKPSPEKNDWARLGNVTLLWL